MTTIEKYTWLVKHLSWNASKPTGKTFWVKITAEEVPELEKEFPVIDTRALYGGVKVDVINMFDNNVVLDTRLWK